MNKKTIEIKEEFIKLDSLIKYIGITQTGAEAKFLIREGKIKVNNEICEIRGKKIYIGDKVLINDIIYEVKKSEDRKLCF